MLKDHIFSNRAKRRSAQNQMLAGLFSGVSIAGFFNPWDRALYLSVLKDRPFLHWKNWRKPYLGFHQAVFHRTLSGGLYYPLYDIFHDPVSNILHANDPMSSSIQSTAVAGILAGATNGALLNNLTTVKYQSWGTDNGFFYTAKRMYQTGGVSPFLVGIYATVARDVVFGMCYAVIRHMWQVSILPSLKDEGEMRKVLRAGGSLSGALCATVLSSPLNYARNMQYGTPPTEKQKSTLYHLQQLKNETLADPRPFSFLQRRLRVGWGSLRVAVGMGVGQEVYDVAKEYLDNHNSDWN